MHGLRTILLMLCVTEGETMADKSASTDDGHRHLNGLTQALAGLDVDRITLWGTELADRLSAGRTLLVAGNGGSAAEAQHLTAELVGRYKRERRGVAAIALHADTSTVTAVANDYGYDQVFARQVEAHARPGDVLLLLSTSGRSPNLLRAAEAARAAGVTTWALTGPGPSPLTELADEAVTIDGATTANVQECHLVVAHLLAAVVEERLVEEQAAGTPAVLAVPGPSVLPVPVDSPAAVVRPSGPARRSACGSWWSATHSSTGTAPARSVGSPRRHRSRSSPTWMSPSGRAAPVSPRLSRRPATSR